MVVDNRLDNLHRQQLSSRRQLFAVRDYRLWSIVLNRYYQHQIPRRPMDPIGGISFHQHWNELLEPEGLQNDLPSVRWYHHARLFPQPHLVADRSE